jgi:hypothetical protein
MMLVFFLLSYYYDPPPPRPITSIIKPHLSAMCGFFKFNKKLNFTKKKKKWVHLRRNFETLRYFFEREEQDLEI